MDPQAPNVSMAASEEPYVPKIPQAPQPMKDNHWVSILAMAIFILFALGVVAFLYYQNQQLKSMLASYQTPVPSSTPTATADPTANWKTYTNTKYGFSFKYPTEYKYEENNYPKEENGIYSHTIIVVANTKDFDPEPVGKPFIQLTISDSVDHKVLSELYNNTTTVDSISANGIQIDIRQATNGDKSFVFVKNKSTYEFNLDSSLMNNFYQILSTFKFVEATPSATPPTTGYTCPANGYVDCMPVLTPEKQATCSAEAMAWYKANCPNFKGGAY